MVFVTGPFGYTSIGLNILIKKKKVKSKFVEKSIKSVINPKPKLSFGLKNKKYFSSSMDSSDGLSNTLNEMAKQSGKKFIVNNIPSNKDLEYYAKKRNLNLNSIIFNGGEEYEFIFTIPVKYRKNIIKNAKLLKTPIIEIGYVTAGKGVFLKNADKNIIVKDLGWKHFK